MNEIKSNFQALPVREFPVRSEEDLSFATGKNPGESLLLRKEEEKMKDSVAPQHVEISNFEMEEDEEGESIKQDKINEAEKYIKFYPKALRFTWIGTLFIDFGVLGFILLERSSDFCRRSREGHEIVFHNNTEQILYWLCHFCGFIMVGFQIAFLCSAAKAVKKRDYAQSVFASKMMTGCLIMLGLILVLLWSGYPGSLIRPHSCSISENLETSMYGIVLGGFIFASTTFGIYRLRSALSALAQYGKISPS